MRNKRLFLFVIVTLVLASCKESARKADSYFDSLVTSQVNILTLAKASVIKKASIDGNQDETTFTPDSTLWESELDIFRQLEIYERPAYTDAYEMKDGIPDEKSNLTVRSYHSLKNIPVRDLKFYYHDQFQQLKKIEATYQEKNTLYTTRRSLQMEFDEVNGKSVLSSYSISGVQKMVLSDSVKFSIHSKVIF
jgi:hypothetical protein